VPKILLDECIDWRYGKELTGYDVTSVPKMGWNGLKNGALLSKAQDSFDIFITTDRNLTFQQNIPTFDIAIIILSTPSNRLQDLIRLVPKVLESLPNVKPGKATIIQS
jgi:hypothetical protein